MPSKKLLQEVLKKITPTKKESLEQKKLAEKLIKEIKSIEGKHTDVVLCGSIARDTHLKGDNDLDVFVLFPEKLGREEFEKEGLRIGKRVFRGKQWEKAFSEHPYIRGNISGCDVEIVPSYKVSKAELLQSSVDRSPFHNAYLLEKLSEKHRKEVRLLKQFLKGIKCYGADLKVSSVPGYVTELLTLNYGSFVNVLKAVSQWHLGQVTDIEKCYKSGTEAQKVFPDAPLIVVDPVDKKRNVAAALSLSQFARFIAASRAFLKKPSKDFFFGKKVKPWPLKKVKRMLQKKELVAVKIGWPSNALPDILWGQIRKLGRKLLNQLERNDFRVLRTDHWSDEKRMIIFVFEVEALHLQKTAKKSGPSVTNAAASLNFLNAHKNLIAGPWIEEGRWVIEVPRKHVSIKTFLGEELRSLKKADKENIRKAINKGSKILLEKDIIALYKKNKEFAEFLTTYLRGKEDFLEY